MRVRCSTAIGIGLICVLCSSISYLRSGSSSSSPSSEAALTAKLPVSHKSPGRLADSSRSSATKDDTPSLSPAVARSQPEVVRSLHNPRLHGEHARKRADVTQVNVPQSQVAAAKQVEVVAAPPKEPAVPGSADGAAAPGADAPWKAWIFGPGVREVYTPTVATLKEGFGSFGAFVQVAQCEESCKVLKDSNQTLQRKQPLLVLAIGFFNDRSVRAHSTGACKYWHTLELLCELGAYVVLYNTEPAAKDFHKAPKLLRKWKAQEIWSYSNVQPAELWRHANFTSRFVPAGCAEELQVNVDRHAPDRHLTGIGFVGSWGYRPLYLRQMYQTAFQHELAPRDNISVARDWQRFLSQYPLQFNAHARWNSVLGFESLRVAVLATNYACVLSVRSSKSDEAKFEGIIKFGNQRTLRRLYSRLRGNDEAIRECQEETQRLFCERFAPRKVLEDAGFEEVLAKMGVSTSSS